MLILLIKIFMIIVCDTRIWGSFVLVFRQLYWAIMDKLRLLCIFFFFFGLF